METNDVLADAFGRIVENFEFAVAGLTPDELTFRPDPDANSIAWLAWHAVRVQDDHVSALANRPQTWTEDGFEQRFGMDLDPGDIGYGHTTDQVAAVRPEGPDLLVAYLHAVTGRTLEYISHIDASELDRIIDRNWDPPVSVGVRLVSVIDDSIQHAGQARYIRGMIERRG
jgi:Protein of unknown function (DUF664)